MTRILTVAAAVTASMALVGCAHQLTPEQAHQLMTDFQAAGCKGRVHADFGASAGLGAQAHASATVDGDCGGAPPPSGP